MFNFVIVVLNRKIVVGKSHSSSRLPVAALIHTTTHTFTFSFWCMDKKKSCPYVCAHRMEKHQTISMLIGAEYDLLRLAKNANHPKMMTVVRQKKKKQQKKYIRYVYYMVQLNETFSARFALLLFIHLYYILCVQCIGDHPSHLFKIFLSTFCIYFVICRLFYNYCNGC